MVSSNDDNDNDDDDDNDDASDRKIFPTVKTNPKQVSPESVRKQKRSKPKISAKELISSFWE